jgi:hypothetical protein
VGEKQLVAQATAADGANADSAIASLRERGPKGLEALVKTHADSIEAYRSWLKTPGKATFDPLWPRLDRALDGVGAQCDNYAARLYWYTDIEKAKAAAKATGRPILSLRLLGKLNQDLSCANSRFIRTALYANGTVSSVLRGQFILHWESVRPVPTITIDFGDGRRIVRTITGNNLHHVLDDQGRPLECLPGLTGPGPFLEWLATSRTLYSQLAKMDDAGRARALRRHHDRRYRDIVVSWRNGLAAIGGKNVQAGDFPAMGFPVKGRVPDAVEAAPVAITKSGIELPMLRAMMPVAQGLEDSTTGVMWDSIAALHRDGAKLDESSLGLMAAKTTVTPAMLERFERSIALDTVRNRYLLQRHIHQWFVNGQVAGDPAALTERVYGELFLTPGDDPWLGLVPPETYAALDKNGLVME